MSSRHALQGFGQAVGSAAHFIEPDSVDAMLAQVQASAEAGISVGLRGAGRSYGDAALNENGLVIGTSRLNQVIAFDVSKGVIDVEPGVTVEDLWRTVLPHGFWPPVVPGTMRPTIGGCVAANVHGKNNFAVGPIGDHVLELELWTPDEGLLICNRQQHADVFHAVIGGFGALGITTRIKLSLKRIETGMVRVEALNVPNLDALFDTFESRLPGADYLVGWTDGFARGASLGRSVIHQANYLAAADCKAPAAQTLSTEFHGTPERFFGVIPKGMMWRLSRPLVNDLGMRLVNFGKFASSLLLDRGQTYDQGLVAFQFLLDYVPRWRDAYGVDGFIQVQPFVPRAAARQTFRRILLTCQEYGIVPYLVVFKRHRPDDFLISHALDGYSLAMDFKVTPQNRRDLWRLGQAIGDMVVEGGGHFYFAKDAVVRPDQVEAAFGSALETFKSLKARLDGGGVLSSDLLRRVMPDLPDVRSGRPPVHESPAPKRSAASRRG